MEIARLQIAVDSLQARVAKVELDKLSGSAGKAEKSAKSTTSAMSGLNKVLAATAGLITVRAIIQASDQYGQMAARIRMATSSTEEYERVQSRLLDTANNTFRALSEAQELYIRTAGAIRSLGFNTEEVLDITDSFSFLLVTNAASADRAASAINAYSKAISTGKVDSDTWQSILAATPTIVDDIARATGSTTDEIRKLGISGKLSLGALNEALLQSRDRNEELAASMETSVADATTALANSFQVFIGKVNETSGASGVLTNQIGELASILQDPKTIEAAQQLAAGVVSALNGIIDVTKDVVTGVRWMGEQLAVTMGGIGLHDVERLEAEASRLQGLLGKVRSEGFGPGSAIFDNLLGSFEENEKRLNQAYSLLDLQVSINKEQVAAPETAPRMQRSAVAAEALASGTKKLTAEQRAQNKAARDLERAQKSNEGVVIDLAEAIYQASLSADELAKRQALLTLNQYATPEQIASVQQLAGELQRVEDIAARKKKFGDDPSATIRGTVTPLSGGAFDDQTARYEAEKQAEIIRYQEQQARLKEALAVEALSRQEAWMMEEQFYQEHTDRLNQIDQARTDMLLQQTSAGFSQMSSDIMDFAAVYARENKTMFAIAKASAIASTIIDTYAAAQAAYKAMAGIPYVGPALGVAAAAAAVGAGMARVSAIESQAMSFEGGGFTGSGPRSGGMDGKGGFMAMVHPNETIIDHTKGQSAGGSGVTINVIESKEKAGTQQTTTNADGSESVDIFVADIAGDGPRSRAMQQAFGLQRQGR